MSVITLDPNDPAAQYEDQQKYLINGGTLQLDTSAGLLGFGKTSNAYATIGPEGGTIDVDLDSSIFSGFSGNYEYSINLQNVPPEELIISYSLNAPNVKATMSYDGTMTTVALKVTGGIFPIKSSITVYIVIPGNSNGLKVGQSITLATSKGDGQIRILCYAEGTFIKTPAGQIRIEDLQVGDMVSVMIDGRETAHPLVWIGSRRIRIENDQDRLVRVRRDALAPRIPFEDLLVTPEHSLVFDNCFVPSRMLVNNATIIQDEALEATVYHLALEHHGILIANGALSESYLDTGNRSLFQEKGRSSMTIAARRKTWSTDAALPLCTEREFVEPLYKSLLIRAQSLGYAISRPNLTTTNDPALCLLADDGTLIKPRRQSDNRYVFLIDPGTTHVWIRSRHSRPCDYVGPFMDDRRSLGVLVASLSLFSSSGLIDVTSYRQDPLLMGWHGCEHPLYRWTDGLAELPLEAFDLKNPALLVIELVLSGPYILNQTQDTSPHISPMEFGEREALFLQ
ncbi:MULTISPECIES: Hint domain-containing protein [Asaia]|uniref:Hint domain-containing protein n=1 Tax=Asaia TaxID=91914 RepID=UPI002FC28E8B